MGSSVNDRLFSRKQTAEILGLRTQTLAKWAMDGRNLPIVRVSPKCVRYRQSDIEEFLRRQTVPAAIACSR